MKKSQCWFDSSVMDKNSFLALFFKTIETVIFDFMCYVRVVTYSLLTLTYFFTVYYSYDETIIIKSLLPQKAESDSLHAVSWNAVIVLWLIVKWHCHYLLGRTIQQTSWILKKSLSRNSFFFAGAWMNNNLVEPLKKLELVPQHLF